MVGPEASVPPSEARQGCQAIGGVEYNTQHPTPVKNVVPGHGYPHPRLDEDVVEQLKR